MAIYDADIRGPLFRKIQIDYSYDPSTIVVPEMDVCAGNARIDIAVINHILTGYEIKSERDTLDRLPSQMEFYNKFFEEITLVVSENHYSEAKKIIPEWWGIECVVNSESILIDCYRKSQYNDSIDSLALTRILWKVELLELLKKDGITKGVKSKSRYELGKKISENLSKENIKEFVKEKLKTRQSWRSVPIQQIYDD